MRLRFTVPVAVLVVLVLLSNVISADGEESADVEVRNMLAYAELVGEAGDFHGIPLPDVIRELVTYVDEDKTDSDTAESEDEDSTGEDSSALAEEEPTESDPEVEGQAAESVEDVTEKPTEEPAEKRDREKKLPTVTGAKKTVFSKHSAGTYIYSSFDETAEGMTLRFDLPKSIKKKDFDKKSLGLGLFISGQLVDGASDSVATVKISLVGEGDEYAATLQVAVGAPVRVTLDLSEIDDGFVPLAVRVQVATDDTPEKETLRITYPYLTAHGKFNFLRDNGLSYVSTIQGDVRIYQKKIVAYFDASEVILATGVAESEGEKTVKYLSVGASSGTASVLVSKPGTVSPLVSSMTVSRKDGRGLFRVTDMYGGVAVVLKGQEGKRITLQELSVLDTHTPVESDYGATIGTMSIDESILHVEGRLDEDIVKSYMMNYLGVYMVPAVGEGEAIFLGRGSIATRFSVDVDLEAYPHAASDYKFYLAVSDSDGEVLRLSEPRFALSSGTKTSFGSLFALHMVDPVSVYESGASTVMVDVDVKRLIDTDGTNSATISRGGYAFAVNSDYLRRLDTDMEFYRSSGVSVYLRLISSGEIISNISGESLTLGGEGALQYLIKADVAEAVNLYMAVVSHLSQRYPNISSFVLSGGINSVKYTGLGEDSITDYAAEVVQLIRLVGGAANNIGEGISVTVPFVPAEKGDYPAESLAALISEELSRLGQIPWMLMYTDSSAKLPNISENIIHAQRLNGTVAAIGSAYCFVPENEKSLAKDYLAICSATAGRQERIVFLSEVNLSEPVDRDVLEKLKFELKSENSHLLDAEVESSESFDMAKFTGEYVMWDFTSSHSTLGWTAFYGIDSVSTAAVDMTKGDSAGRVLRSFTESTADRTAGIILRRLDKSLSLAEMPYVEFEFMCKSETPVQITFVFGKGENRAEFVLPGTLSPDENGVYRGICDLSRFPARLDLGYIGVIIYSDKVAQFDLSSVKFYSSTMTDEEMSSALTSAVQEDVKKELPVKRITVAAFVLVFVLIMSVRALSYVKHKDTTMISVTKRTLMEKGRRDR